MRGGGRHKDKKRSEKKQPASAKENEQMSTEEQKIDEDPVTQRVDKDSMIRQLEESEGYQKILEHVSQGSEEEVDQKVQKYLAYIQELSLLGKEQLENLKVKSGRTLKRGGEEEARGS